MRCLSCSSYFRHTAYNQSSFCEYCLDAEDLIKKEKESDVDLEIELLVNPSGRRQAVIYEDRNDATDGYHYFGDYEE
jgi:glutaredoxin